MPRQAASSHFGNISIMSMRVISVVFISYNIVAIVIAAGQPLLSSKLADAAALKYQRYSTPIQEISPYFSSRG